MAFVFTLLFVLTAYLTPAVLWGPLEVIHPEVLFAFLALIVSIPEFGKTSILKSPQALALGGICAAVLISIATSGWLGGALSAVYYVLPLPWIYFMASMHINTKKRLRLVYVGMMLISVYYMIHGIMDLRNNVVPSLYLYGDDTLRRLRGLGFVFDPNDFGQVMVALIPGMLLLKGKGSSVITVGIPIALLITGLYLTHSRGAAVALMVVIAISLRRRLGGVPAGILAACIFAASLALGWSGGRDVSMEAGADRMDAWSTGLEMIRSHPIAGVGIQQFGEYNNGLTAHNSIVVCAAEIGLLGFFFWVLFVFTTLRNSIRVGQVLERDKNKKKDAPPEEDPSDRYALRSGKSPVQPSVNLTPPPPSKSAPVDQKWVPLRFQKEVAEQAELADEDQEDLRRTVRILAYSFIGFLAAGWFLSRAMSLWLFLLAGMNDGMVRVAVQKGIPFESDRLPILFRYSAITAASLLMVLYVLLRVRSH